jgi:hypothetical protein
VKQLPASIDLPALERGVLARWERDRVFERSLEQTAGGEPWVFYEGPPTANGKPGTHHVEARVFKDLFPRFKTMQGRHVPRRPAGTATACRSSWPSRRSSASPASRTSRRTASRSSTPSAARASSGTSTSSSA